MKIEKGSKVFITGAGSGIGRSTAIAMGKMGSRLFLTDINRKGLDDTVEMASKGGGEVCKSRCMDVSKFEEVAAFAGEIHKEFGPMDIIMNIAGVALYALIEDMKHEHWERIIKINLWGPIHVIESFLPEMIKAKRGYVVNVSSLSGLIGLPWHVAYAASKFGLVGVSEVLRYDLMQHNIGVTVVCPGAVDTPLKNSVVILGVDPEREDVKEAKRRFEQHAVSPDKVAQQIVNAVQKNKFLVITSADVRFLYFFKQHIFPIFNYVMIKIASLMNSGRYPSGTR